MRAVAVTLRVLGIAALAAIQLAWLAYPQPLAAKIAPLALLAVSLVRPDLALLLLAAASPVATTLSGLVGTPLASAKFLEQLVLAVVNGALIRGSVGTGRTRLGAPAALFAAVGAASALAIMPTRAAVAMTSASALQVLGALWHREYFVRSSFSDPLYFGVLGVEAALLAWLVERRCRVAPGLAGRLVDALLVGGAATSTEVFLRMLRGAATHGRFAADLYLLFVQSRMSVETDVNAAASILLLILVAGIGRTLGRTGVARAWRAAMVVIVAVGLWQAGSRIAEASLVMALATAGVAIAARGSARVRRWVAAGLVAGLALSAVVVAHYPTVRNTKLSYSISTRTILLEAGYQMFRSAPVFGVGIGRFFDESGVIAGEELTRWGVGGRENAHDNFLQVLAEEGLAGLVSLMLVLGLVAWGALRSERRAANPTRFWLFFGLGATVLTWLTGHPLLVPEYAFIFWIALGVLASMTTTPRTPALVWVTSAAIVGLVASVPVRATAHLGDAGLGHLGSGFSQWQHDSAVPYRWAGVRSALYVPTGSRIDLPVRREPHAPDPLHLALSIDGHPVDAVTLVGDDWQTVPLLIPHSRREYVLVDFEVTNAPAAPPARLVDIGKVNPR